MTAPARGASKTRPLTFRQYISAIERDGLVYRDGVSVEQLGKWRKDQRKLDAIVQAHGRFMARQDDGEAKPAVSTCASFAYHPPKRLIIIERDKEETRIDGIP